MKEPAEKNLSIESFLDAIETAAYQTKDKLVIEWTKELIEDICNEKNLCKSCHEVISRVVSDRRYIVEFCGCKEKLIGNW